MLDDVTYAALIRQRAEVREQVAWMLLAAPHPAVPSQTVTDCYAGQPGVRVGSRSGNSLVRSARDALQEFCRWGWIDKDHDTDTVRVVDRAALTEVAAGTRPWKGARPRTAQSEAGAS